MIASLSTQHRVLSEVAERQMRKWALQREAQQREAEKRSARPLPRLIHPYLAISRETGADAGELAQAVAAKCGWKVFDRELLDYLVEHDQRSRLALEFVDERARSWFHEMFGKWLEKQLISQAEYVIRLRQVALLAAQHESTVFVGRGVQFMLPRANGISARIIAPKTNRVKRIMDKRHVGMREAEKFVDDTDRGRAQFVQQYFHCDVADPHLYDLVINLEHVPRDTAVDLIASECHRRETATMAGSQAVVRSASD